MAAGGKGLVKASEGFHSKKYIGMTGVSVMKLSANPSKHFWVLRFPSVLPATEEGLFEESEIQWIS